MGRPKTDARERLLAATMDYLAENGISDLTLRQLAPAIGTSHRMLIYHFGSKENLLVAVVRAIEAREQQVLASESFIPSGTELTPIEELREVWRYCIDPAWDNYLRLFFELYGQALQGRPHTAEFLDGVVDAWLGPFTEIFRRTGVTAREARADARLTLAVFRGLFLDLLATGDKAAVNRAFERYLQTHEATIANVAKDKRKRRSRNGARRPAAKARG